MSYNIRLVDPVSKNTIHLEQTHMIKGGTFAIGGTTECWLNVTYNYAPHFYKHLGEKGIREIYGKTGAEAIPMLEKAISKLGDDVNENYWKSTEGNAKLALHGLLAFAKLRPDGIFEGH